MELDHIHFNVSTSQSTNGCGYRCISTEAVLLSFNIGKFKPLAQFKNVFYVTFSKGWSDSQAEFALNLPLVYLSYFIDWQIKDAGGDAELCKCDVLV